jgi:hypothetical protein
MRRRRTDTQQLVIPRGMLGPEEVAVIEIPKRFHKTPVVVLKRRPGELARIRASHYFVEAPYDMDPAMKNTRFMVIHKFIHHQQLLIVGIFRIQMSVVKRDRI